MDDMIKLQLWQVAAAYDNYLNEKLVDIEYSDDLIKESIKNLPDIK
jgi:tryptophan synthase beta chain